MLSYSQVYSLVETAISSMLLENEVIMDDIAAYELTMRLFGFEKEAEFGQVYQHNRAGAQCFAGELGEAALDMSLAQVSEAQRQQAEESVRIARGRIFYYIDALVEAAVDMIGRNDLDNDAAVRYINRLVIFVVAHERRHSHQPVSMLDIQVTDLENLAAYQAQRHEADADAFATAVVRHEASLSDVATWRPAA